MIAALALVACGAPERSDAPPDAPAAAPPAAMAQAPEAFAARGAEPFWALTIAEEGLELTQPDFAPLTAAYAPPAIREGANGVRVLEFRNDAFLAVIVEKPCVEPSGETAPFTAEVIVEEAARQRLGEMAPDLLTGCAVLG